ncbi:MAG TPA: PfkB family carbohydrate kinase, partial [Actinomycetota bacterium]
AVDTTGAGDTHVAVFLARLAAGDDPARAAWVANVAASLSVRRAGPAGGPTAEELQAALDEG